MGKYTYITIVYVVLFECGIDNHVYVCCLCCLPFGAYWVVGDRRYTPGGARGGSGVTALVLLWLCGRPM